MNIGVPYSFFNPVVNFIGNKFIKATLRVTEVQRKDLSEIDSNRLRGEAVALCVRIKNKGPKAANKCGAELRLRGENSCIVDDENTDIIIETINVNPVPWDNDGARSETTLNPDGGRWLIVAYTNGYGEIFFPEGSDLSPVTPEWLCRTEICSDDLFHSHRQDFKPQRSRGIPAEILVGTEWTFNELAITGQTKASGFKATEAVQVMFTRNEQGKLTLEIVE